MVCTCLLEDIFFSKYKYDISLQDWYRLLVPLFILRTQFTGTLPMASVVKFLGLHRWLESPSKCNHKSQWGETTHSRYWCSHFSLSVWINTEKATPDNTSTNWLAECLRYDNSTNNILSRGDCCADERLLGWTWEKKRFDLRVLCMFNVDTSIWKLMVLFLINTGGNTFLLWILL